MGNIFTFILKNEFLTEPMESKIVNGSMAYLIPYKD
jgi:hypothetical protein